MSSYFPTKEEFVRKSGEGNMMPVYKEILADLETPVSAFKKIGTGKFSFLLESVEGGERIARFSFLGADPGLIIRSKNRRVELIGPQEHREITLDSGEDVLSVLKREMEKIRYVPDANLPKFCGGAVGYIGYDVVRFFETLPDSVDDDLALDDCVLAFTDTLLIFDHVAHKIRVVCNARIEGDPEAAYDDATRKIETLIARLKAPLSFPPYPTPRPAPDVKSNFTEDGFKAAVSKCKEYIAAGDLIQVVLSQRFETAVSADPFDIYRALRSLNPSPYMYYLNYDDIKLIGSSPEILVTVQGDVATTRPIAGTRPRGSDSSEDERLAAELLADEKERAEHIMLVDLGRNDLGRVCEYGTVNVDELMIIEKYSHVMHIVSNVRGKMDDAHDQFDVLRACFPAGTVSGAPKVRAMEIIDELEPTRRGPYAGAIGYFSYSGDMDTCITIRTIMIRNGKAYIQAGAGIVADSDPASEYRETQNKAMAMIKAIQAAEAGLE